MPNKKIIIVVIAIVFCTLAVYAQKNVKNRNNNMPNSTTGTFVLTDDFFKIKSLYGNHLILYSLRYVLSDKFKDFFVEEGTSVSDADWNNRKWRTSDILDFQGRIDRIVAKKPTAIDSLLFVVQNMEESGVIIKQIEDWCETFTVLSTSYKYGGYADTYPEILFEIPEIHNVTRSFIDTTHPGQGWFSLSTSQLSYLRYEISNYVSTLSDAERFSFYKSLFSRTTYYKEAD